MDLDLIKHRDRDANAISLTQTIFRAHAYYSVHNSDLYWHIPPKNISYNLFAVSSHNLHNFYAL